MNPTRTRGAIRTSGIVDVTQFALQLPEDLTAVEDIETLLTQATEAFDQLFEEVAGAPNDEQLAELTRLRDQVQAITAEQARRAEDATRRAEALENLRRDVPSGGAEDGAGEGEGEEGEGEEGEGEEGEGEGEEAAPSATEAAGDLPDQIAASGAGRGRPSLSNVRHRARPATPPNRRRQQGGTNRAVITASGVAGTTPNASPMDLAEAFNFQASLMPTPGTRGRQRLQAGSIRLQFPDNLTASGNLADDATELLRFAADESRLEGGSLTASGNGWCAPSMTDYSIPDDGASLDGLVDVPETGISRGGLKFTRGVSFANVYGLDGIQTEAQNIAGGVKTFASVDCPGWEEERLDAIYFGVKVPIMMDFTYPEATRQFLNELEIAHQHRISASTIARMVAKSTVVPAIAGTHAATATLLGALELHAEDIRYKYRLTRNGSLEIELPFWIMPVLRNDYAQRNGIPNPFDVNDEMIMKWFTDRNFAVQFVYDWQDSITGGAGGGPGDPDTLPVGFPATVKVLMYPAGTFVRSLADVISINTLYDSAMLEENEKLIAFTEQGLLVAMRGFESRVLTVGINADGWDALVAATDANA